MSAEAIHFLRLPLKHKPADISPQGEGSGLDADTVDGKHASEIGGGLTPHDRTYHVSPSIPEGDLADTVVEETSFGQSPSPGSSTKAARADHTHGTPEFPVLLTEYGEVVF